METLGNIDKQIQNVKEEKKLQPEDIAIAKVQAQIAELEKQILETKGPADESENKAVEEKARAEHEYQEWLKKNQDPFTEDTGEDSKGEAKPAPAPAPAPVPAPVPVHVPAPASAPVAETNKESIRPYGGLNTVEVVPDQKEEEKKAAEGEKSHIVTSSTPKPQVRKLSSSVRHRPVVIGVLQFALIL